MPDIDFTRPKKIRVEIEKYDDDGNLIDVFSYEEVLDAADDSREDVSGTGGGG